MLRYRPTVSPGKEKSGEKNSPDGGKHGHDPALSIEKCKERARGLGGPGSSTGSTGQLQPGAESGSPLEQTGGGTGGSQRERDREGGKGTSCTVTWKGGRRAGAGPSLPDHLDTGSPEPQTPHSESHASSPRPSGATLPALSSEPAPQMRSLPLPSLLPHKPLQQEKQPFQDSCHHPPDIQDTT